MNENRQIAVIIFGALLLIVPFALLSGEFTSAALSAGLLACLVSWAYVKVYLISRKQARREIKAIAQAMRGYVEYYGELPTVDWQQDEQPMSQLLSVLSGSNMIPATILSPRSTDGGVLNPEKIDFLKDLRKLKKKALELDPWGRSYRVALGLGENGITNIESSDSCSLGGVQTLRTVSERIVNVSVNSPFAIWSTGPDGINDCGYGDDVCSWK